MTSSFALRDIVFSVGVAAKSHIHHVLIYGAGEAGAQLAAFLKRAGTHEVLAFIDDSSNLWGRTIIGIEIRFPSITTRLRGEVDQVLLAVPSLSSQSRLSIVARLREDGLFSPQIPSLEDITSGRAQIDALRPVAIEDLLGRDSVPPDS